jgi:transposase
MREFVENNMPYLQQYHQKSNSRSGFAANKKMLEWNIAQRRDDRTDIALFWTGVWHNMFNMRRSKNSAQHPFVLKFSSLLDADYHYLLL